MGRDFHGTRQRYPGSVEIHLTNALITPVLKDRLLREIARRRAEEWPASNRSASAVIRDALNAYLPELPAEPEKESTG